MILISHIQISLFVCKYIYYYQALLYFISFTFDLNLFFYYFCNMESLGEKIKKIRKAKGISQTVVAEMCGIKQSSFANIETGKTQNISIEIGRGIAKALRVSFDELFEIESTTDKNDNSLKEFDSFKKKIESLLERISEKEKIINLQDQVSQNMRNAIFEANYQAMITSSIDIHKKAVDPKQEMYFLELFSSHFQTLLKNLVEWGCLTEKDIESYYEKKREFLQYKITKIEE